MTCSFMQFAFRPVSRKPSQRRRATRRRDLRRGCGVFDAAGNQVGTSGTDSATFAAPSGAATTYYVGVSDELNQTYAITGSGSGAAGGTGTGSYTLSIGVSNGLAAFNSTDTSSFNTAVQLGHAGGGRSRPIAGAAMELPRRCLQSRCPSLQGDDDDRTRRFPSMTALPVLKTTMPSVVKNSHCTIDHQYLPVLLSGHLRGRYPSPALR